MFVYNFLMDIELTNKSKIRKRKAALNVSFSVKKERNSVYQKVSTLLQKPSSDRSPDEVEFLNNSKDIVQQITLRKAQRQKVKDRAQEYEDAPEILSEKCKSLAEAVKKSKHLVVYTGAGISTAARIPDYRGSNGIWTLLQQGKDIGLHDLSRAEPTLTHMALYGLYRAGILKHVVSQNCDGLHLRSGVPKTILSEVHGNMYLEVCIKCKPCNHYLRLFDVTENTARYSHETLRLCYKCGNPLKDTIVHFGERGKLQWPLNWVTACDQADKADVILCLGSSLKVLKRYPWLWCMDKPMKKRPKLYIVNLQWTPKDDHSTLKINGKCDTVIEQVMSHLGLIVPKYVRSLDPIFHHATVLHELEIHTTTRTAIEKTLKPPTSDKVEDAEEKLIKMDVVLEGENTTDVMCSSTQVNSVSNDKPTCDNSENVARPTDLISSNDIVLVKNESTEDDNAASVKNDNKVSIEYNSVVCVKIENVQNENVPDKNSDKENHVTTINVVTSEIVEDVKTESSETEINLEGQSFTVINEKRTVEVKQEEDHPSEPTETSDAQNGTSSNIDLQSVKVYNGIHFLYGRNLWSDLSVFDTLTNQPVLMNPDVNDYSSLAACKAKNASNGLHQKDSAKETETECVTSSSKETRSRRSGRLAEEKLCEFCLKHYESKNCLFYMAHSSNTPFSPISSCLCCGDDEDDEPQEEEEEDSSSDKTPIKVPNINPGWFGKGYRKKYKKKK